MTFRVPSLEAPIHAARLRRLQVRLSRASALLSRAAPPHRISRAKLVLSWLVGLCAGAAVAQIALRMIA